VVPVPFRELASPEASESSADVRTRVMDARRIQHARFSGEEGVYCNALMSGRLLRTHCAIDANGQQLLRTVMEKLDLSARAHDRILKVARTIADLAGSPRIANEHLAEAINYRSMDRSGWGNKR
jgi:magnesium chelatase family protein